MGIQRITSNYFNGFNELSEAKKNTALTNLCAVIKVLSYLTLVIPAIVYGINKASSLFGRVQTSPPNQSQADTINQTAQGTLTHSAAASDTPPLENGEPSTQNLQAASNSSAQPALEASEEVNDLGLGAASEHVQDSSEAPGPQASEEAEIPSDTHSVSSSSSGTESPIFEEISDTGSRAAATTVPILGVPNSLGAQKKTSSRRPTLSNLLAAAAKIALQQRNLKIAATQSPSHFALKQDVNPAETALLEVARWIRGEKNTNSGSSSTDPQS